MSKWKQYEGITTVAKKVGGPNVLVALIFTSGTLFFAGISHAYAKRKLKQKHDFNENRIIYEIVETGYVNNKEKLDKGTKFYVVERDCETVIIRVIGEDFPIIAEFEQLSKISNYK